MTRARICDIHKGGTPGARYWTRGPKGAWPVPEARDLCGRCAGALMEQGQPLYLDEACKVLASTVGEAQPSPPAPAPKVGGEPTRSRGTSAASHHEASPARPAAPVEQPPVPSVGSAAGGHPTSLDPEKKMKTCLVPRCKNSVKAKGRCSRHYELARDGGWRDEDPVGDLERIAEYRKTGQPRRAPATAPLIDQQGVEQAAASVAPGPVDADVEVSTVAVGGDVAGAQALEQPGQQPAVQVEPRFYPGELEAFFDKLCETFGISRGNDVEAVLQDLVARPSGPLVWAVLDGTDAMPWEEWEVLDFVWTAAPEDAYSHFPPPPEGYQRRVVEAAPGHLSLLEQQQIARAIAVDRESRRARELAAIRRLRDQLAAVHVLDALRAIQRAPGLPQGPLENLLDVIREVAAGHAPMPSLAQLAGRAVATQDGSPR